MKALRRRLPNLWSEDHGDVPGWVLITLMTAGLATPNINRGIT
jgi:hypothetical protein